jgi:transposase InsO family protein
MRVLRFHGIRPSMSRPANPYDNAACESFIKTLKREEIYANQYRDLDDLRTCAPASRSSSTATTTGFVCTRPWTTPRRSSSKPVAQPKLPRHKLVRSAR